MCLVLCFFPLCSHGASMCELGVETSSTASLPVLYNASTKVPYSDARPRPFSMIVFHDPGSAQCDPVAMLKYGQTYDKRRDGMFGYHFYIARDGTVYQGAPLIKRTNHVSGSYRRTQLQYSNSSAIGISLMCGHMKIPEAQLQSAVRLGHMLQVAYNIPASRIFGHGELQYNRLPNEGLIAARATRTTYARGSDALSVQKKQTVATCEIIGTPPPPCDASRCEIFAAEKQKTIEGLPPGLYKILTSNTGYEIPKTTLRAGTRIPLPQTRSGGGPTSFDASQIDTDARAWGYGEAKARASSGNAETHFSNPLDSFRF
jgi:hypothetical protein